MPKHIAQGNATRARARAKVEPVFTAENRRFEPVIRTIGPARATAKIAPASRAYTFTRLAWLQGRAASA